MQLVINGEAREVEGTPTLGEFLTARNLLPRMVVVERNGDIVPREKYDETLLMASDVLEIVQMMAGG